MFCGRNQDVIQLIHTHTEYIECPVDYISHIYFTHSTHLMEKVKWVNHQAADQQASNHVTKYPATLRQGRKLKSFTSFNNKDFHFLYIQFVHFFFFYIFNGLICTSDVQDTKAASEEVVIVKASTSLVKKKKRNL